MSAVEELILRRESLRQYECLRYAEFLIKRARKRPHDPGLCNRIEAALSQAARSEEIMAELADRLNAVKEGQP